MSTKVLIHHSISYTYDRLVNLSTQLIRLFPSSNSKTSIREYSLTIQPHNHVISRVEDLFGNMETRVSFNGPVLHFSINVVIIAVIEPVNPFTFVPELTSTSYPFQYSQNDQPLLECYLEDLSEGPLFDAWVASLDSTALGIVDFLSHINQRLHQDVTYVQRMEPGIQTPEVSLAQKNGSCRDSAWLLVKVFRRLKLAARFVSGYIVQLTENGDSTGLHAWTEVYLPGAGWIGLDPSNGLFAAEGYIPMASAPHYEQASPTTGLADSANATLKFANTVIRM